MYKHSERCHGILPAGRVLRVLMSHTAQCQGAFREPMGWFPLNIQKAITAGPENKPLETLTSILRIGTIIQIPIASLCFF